jgi:hypothetical protein
MVSGAEGLYYVPYILNERRIAGMYSSAHSSSSPKRQRGRKSRKSLEPRARVTALPDRLLHHAHVLMCGLRSWCAKIHPDLRAWEVTK